MTETPLEPTEAEKYMLLDAAQYDMDLDMMRTAGLALGGMIGRARTAAAVLEQAIASAIHGEVEYASGLFNDGADPDEKLIVIDVGTNTALGEDIRSILGDIRAANIRVRSAEPCVDTRCEDGASTSDSDDLLHEAWALIANAGWDAHRGIVDLEKSPGWHDAAVRWRDRFHAQLGATPDEMPASPATASDPAQARLDGLGDSTSICGQCGGVIFPMPDEGTWRHAVGPKHHAAAPAEPFVQVLQEPETTAQACSTIDCSNPAAAPMDTCVECGPF